MNLGYPVASPLAFMEAHSLMSTALTGREDARVHGFYRTEHDIPGPPVLVMGDPAAFARQREAMRQRLRRRMDAVSGTRHFIRTDNEFFGEAA